ncbi:MAG: ABC transporter substrate-binding protein [Eubacteriales bacterium]
MNEKNIPFEKKYEGKYPEIYGKNQDVEGIKSRLRKKHFIIQSIIIFFFVAVPLSYNLSQQSGEQDLGYLGGNIMYLSFGSEGAPSNVLNVANPWVSATFVTQLLFDTLFETDSSYTEVNPKLAEKLEILDDGYTYVITMKNDQYWSDGEKITAEDVIFSLQAFLLNADGNTYMTTAFRKIQGATDFIQGKTESLSGISLEGNQITIRLESLHSNFDVMLTQLVPLPRHILEGEDVSTLTQNHDFFKNNHGIYSGQYVVDGFDEDMNLILKQNPYYNNSQSEIETILLCWDFENTDIDYYPTSDLSKMISYRSMKGFDEYEVSVFFYRYFIFNVSGGENNSSHQPMEDVRVRQAIYHAIDVDTLMQEVYLGRTTRFYGGAMDIAQEFAEYDPELAVQLLEEADFDFDRPFKIHYYSEDTSARLFVERVADNLEEIGITVITAKVEVNQLFDNPDYDMMMKNLSAFNTADWYSEYLSSNALLSQILGTEGLFDPLVNELLTTPDSEKYEEILIELVELEQEMLYKMPMFLIDEGIYINSNRLSLPEDMVFGNTRYFSDIRLDEWYIKKGIA